MGKPTGFLEYDRAEDGMAPVRERIKNFDTLHTELSEEERREQGARCMNCGVPFCQSGMKLSGMVTGCPLHNLIPEWNDQVYKGHFHHALSRLLKTNNFPEFTGNVCPALCEKACINGEYGDSVTIRDNEKYIIEKAYANGWMEPRIPEVRSGKKVAVIGSGPAGLAAADTLNHRGHNVTVFERDDRAGGLLMYGIPNMKLDKRVVERRIELMKKEGVEFKLGVNVGVDVTAEELTKEYDAVILACGAKQARGLAAADPAKVKGVFFAVDFLSMVTKDLLNGEEKYGLSADSASLAEVKKLVNGKNVVVVGGGDTGNDCTGTVIRLGAKSVTALEMMPKPPVERAANNPWPEWPKVLKTDYGQEEAIEKFGSDPRVYETTVKSVKTDKKGQLTGITTVRVHFTADRKLEEEKGSEKEIPCELLLIAAGFTGCEKYTADAFKAALTPRNVIETEPDHYKTKVDKVFTAGDMHRGQSLVVWAITEGRAAAKEVDEFLMGYTNI